MNLTIRTNAIFNGIFFLSASGMLSKLNLKSMDTNNETMAKNKSKMTMINLGILIFQILFKILG